MKAIFLDIETTGLDPLQHKPIDIALKILNISSGEIIDEYQSLIWLDRTAWESHDPLSMDINGYSYSDIIKGKKTSLVSKEIQELFQKNEIQRGKAIFICQNPAFDRAFFIHIISVYTQERLQWPYHWLDLASMYWALLSQRQMIHQLPFPEEINLSKNAIAQLYNIPEEARPHRAMQGVDHLIACYLAVLTQEGRCPFIVV